MDQGDGRQCEGVSMRQESGQVEGALRETERQIAQLGQQIDGLFKQTQYEDLEHAGLGLAIARHAVHEVLEHTGQGGHIEHTPDAAAHAQAGLVVVELAQRDGSVELAVRDDGRGFDLGLLPQRISEGHIGLQSQRERVESAGGRFEIRSAPGRGTEVEIRLPG